MKKTLQNIFIIIVTGAAMIGFIWVVMHIFFYSSPSDITVPVAQAATVPLSSSNVPVYLSIPTLGIKANIQEVGVTSDGKMAVPDNFTDVGWYKYGTVPGQTGSAVIAGHVDDGLAFPAVFVDLYKLKPGDSIYITTKGGTVLHFVMTGSQSYDRNDTDTSSIFNDNSGKILRLITCTGTWLPAQKTHDERLVVTAVLQE